MRVEQATPLYGALLAASNRMEKHGEVMRGEDGIFAVPGKYWTITCKEMAVIEQRGLVRIDHVGESVFAVFIG